MDDEADVPAHRLADQPLDGTPHRFFGLDRDGDVHIGGPVHQGQRFAEPGPALQSHRRELQEQLVQLPFETGGEIARCPPAPDLGIDVGHHLGHVPRPVRPLQIVYITWRGRLDGSHLGRG